MSWLDRLERRCRRFAIPNLTGFLAGFQAALWVLIQILPRQAGQASILDAFVLIPAKVLDGEIWRLVTFVFLPPGVGILAIFGIYLFWLMGTALEGQWGTVRYNFYVLIAVLATITAAFLLPNGGPATNMFIGSSVFLAFAYLYPDFTLSIYFLLPIRVKWLALLTWIGYAVVLVVGDWSSRMFVLASIANFLLFFGRDLLSRVRSGQRTMHSASRRVAETGKPFHTCVICGLTEQDEPDEDFRICSQCNAGTFEYCSQHLRNHEHRMQPP